MADIASGDARSRDARATSVPVCDTARGHVRLWGRMHGYTDDRAYRAVISRPSRMQMYHEAESELRGRAGG